MKQPQWNRLDAPPPTSTPWRVALLMVTGEEVSWVLRASLPVCSRNPLSPPPVQDPSHFPPFPHTIHFPLSTLLFSLTQEPAIICPIIIYNPPSPQLPVICGLISLLPFLVKLLRFFIQMFAVSKACPIILGETHCLLSDFCLGLPSKVPLDFHHHLHPRVSCLSSS